MKVNTYHLHHKPSTNHLLLKRTLLDIIRDTHPLPRLLPDIRHLTYYYPTFRGVLFSLLQEPGSDVLDSSCFGRFPAADTDTAATLPILNLTLVITQRYKYTQAGMHMNKHTMLTQGLAIHAWSSHNTQMVETSQALIGHKMIHKWIR